MARKTKCPGSGSDKGYLVSFGDTMTALLAFFIVLNSLASDQTGANLHSGTGSFARALNSMGLPTKYPGNRSSQVHQHEYHSPQYIVGSETENDDSHEQAGSDAESDTERVIDREQEDWQRFLRTMRSTYMVESQERESADVTFDFFTPLNREAPFLTPEIRTAVDRLIPALSRPGYEVELTVWATTPGATAWTRAVETAHAVVQEIQSAYLLSSEQRQRMRGIGRPWPVTDAQRPIVSVTVRKVTESP